MKRSEAIDIARTVRGSFPRIPFHAMARAVLGGRYFLSLVVCADALARRINREYRKKDYSPNVLSFPLAKNEGEIFLNVRKARREARAFGIPENDRAAHLFVHGCLHLKGYLHGAAMDREEDWVLKRFGFRKRA